MPKPPVKARDAIDPQHVWNSVFSCGARARLTRCATPPTGQAQEAGAGSSGDRTGPLAGRAAAPGTPPALCLDRKQVHAAQHGELWRARHDGKRADAAEAAALRRANPPHQRDPADHGNGDGLRTHAPWSLLSWTRAGTCGRARARAERTMPGMMPADSESFRMMTVNGSPTTSDQPNMRSVSCSCHVGSSRQPSPVCRARGRRQARAQGPARGAGAAAPQAVGAGCNGCSATHAPQLPATRAVRTAGASCRDQEKQRLHRRWAHRASRASNQAQPLHKQSSAAAAARLGAGLRASASWRPLSRAPRGGGPPRRCVGHPGVAHQPLPLGRPLQHAELRLGGRLQGIHGAAACASPGRQARLGHLPARPTRTWRRMSQPSSRTSARPATATPAASSQY